MPTAFASSVHIVISRSMRAANACGVVGSGSGDIRAQVDAVNIKRRAYYTDLAAKRGAKIEEVAAATACEIFASRVGPGQYYRGTDGNWQQRQGNAPVPRPAYCG